MAFPFSDVDSLGDVLPNDRHSLYFPKLPNGIYGKELTLRNLETSIPQVEVAQIITKPYGWTVSFAGRRIGLTTFSAGFVETTGGIVLNAFHGWQDMCSGFKSPLGRTKAEYAVNCQLVAKDTTGRVSLDCLLHNVWPKTVTPGAFSETSGPFHIEVEFSIDAIDLVTIRPSEVYPSNITAGSTSDAGQRNLVGRVERGIPRDPNGRALSEKVSLGLADLGSPFKSATASNEGFRISQQVVDSVLNPNRSSNSVGRLLNTFFG